jgi:hypothetical protein
MLPEIEGGRGTEKGRTIAESGLEQHCRCQELQKLGGENQRQKDSVFIYNASIKLSSYKSLNC